MALLRSYVLRVAIFIVAIGFLLPNVRNLDSEDALDFHYSYHETHSSQTVIEFTSHSEEDTADVNNHKHEHRHGPDEPLHSHDHSHGGQVSSFEIKISLASNACEIPPSVLIEHFLDIDNRLVCQGHLQGIFRPPIV